jgi:hypothetical protein
VISSHPSRWNFDTETVCYQGKHGILTWVLGIPGLVFIAFLCPVFTAWFLFRNKRRLHTSAFLARFGFLYAEYTPVSERGGVIST